MTKDTMLGRIMQLLVGLPQERLGVVRKLAEVLTENGWQAWLEESKKFFQKKPCWTGEVVKTILEFVGTVTVTLVTGEFVVKDNFVVNTGKDAKVKISYLGDNLKKNFLDKVENLVGDVSLAYHKLKESSRDIPIIGEISGEDQAETMLAVVFSLMLQQSNGEDGVLLNNGYVNIFYVRDSRQVLWAVFVLWRGDGWNVNANPVDDARSWRGGRQVFSRNSSNA